jgi:hypothetical protein
MGNIVGFKSYPNPPSIVISLGGAVCIIVGEEETWEAFKKVCSDRTLLGRMYEVDLDNFKYEDYQNLKLYFREDDFNEMNCKKESVACYSLFKWFLEFDYFYLKNDRFIF